MSSGSLDKLEKYRRFNITEVWLWENEQLSLHQLQNGKYEQIYQSQLLPDLDLS